MRALPIMGVVWGLLGTACSLGVDVGDKQVKPSPTPTGGDVSSAGAAGSQGRGEIAQGGADQGSGEGSGEGLGQGGAEQGQGDGSAGAAGGPGGNEVGGMFVCDDGSLLLPSQDLCDQSVDCPDGSDETVERCSEVQFACEDGSLVLHAKRCDGTVDCSTGEDEACEEAAFRCNDGQFIGGKQRCDGDADCFDGSDELDC